MSKKLDAQWPLISTFLDIESLNALCNCKPLLEYLYVQRKIWNLNDDEIPKDDSKNIYDLKISGKPIKPIPKNVKTVRIQNVSKSDLASISLPNSVHAIHFLENNLFQWPSNLKVLTLNNFDGNLLHLPESVQVCRFVYKDPIPSQLKKLICETKWHAHMKFGNIQINFKEQLSCISIANNNLVNLPNDYYQCNKLGDKNIIKYVKFCDCVQICKCINRLEAIIEMMSLPNLLEMLMK